MSFRTRMVVTHVQTGKVWNGELVTAESKEEFDEMVDAFKGNISQMTYMCFQDTILPGNFIRNHCVIDFQRTIG